MIIMNKNTLSSRIRELITSLGISDAEFARAGEISGPALSMYLNQGRQPKAGCITRWIEHYNIDAHWLLTGEGGVFRQEDNRDNELPSNIIHRPSNPMIAQLETALAALEAADADNKTIQSTITAIVGQNLLHKAPHSIHLTTRNNKANARFYTTKSIILCAGSILEEVQDSISKEALKQRGQAEIEGKMRRASSGKLITTTDIPFKSASSAAGFVVGTSKNGWDYWILTLTGQPIKNFEEHLKTIKKEKYKTP